MNQACLYLSKLDKDQAMLDTYRVDHRGSLSDEQIKFYDREGYLVLPGLLNAADLAAVQAAMMEKVAQIADDLLAAGLITDKRAQSPFATRLAELFTNLTDAHFLKFGRSWRDRMPGYFDIMTNAKILDAVESLIGGEIFANPVYNTRPKVPNVAAGAVPWHQDKSYWPDANANPVITVWLPLVDANLENGCLHIMPRTHHQKVLSWHQESYSGTGYTEIDAEHLGAEKQVIPLPVQAGDAILFNDRCIHMSTPNRSQQVRWSLDLRYQPTDQDPMPQHGVGFLARSYQHPERVATLEDWLAKRPEHLSP
jgi:ectoine hydroxylase-related dioxygenase (phytanoyl-CoA dioxygenase family)